MKDYFFLAFNNLRRRKLRAWLTILGIFIGIAAVVALISLGQGLREAVTGQFGSLSVDKLTIQNSGTGFGPPGSTSIKKLTSHDINIIERVSGVDEVISRLIRIGKIEFNKAAQFNYIGSMPEDKKKLDIIYQSFNIGTDAGRLLNIDDSGKILIGSDIANSENFDKKLEVGKSIKIQGKEFQIIGVLKQASTFQINSVVMMMEKDMKKLLNIGDETDLIVVQIKKGFNIEEVAKAIEDAIRKDRKEKLGEEDFSVQTPIQALSSVNTILTIINAIVSGIAAISLLVGGIGIANTMYTSVLERTKEIGTMKAIGARNSDILYIFIIESGLLGLVGGIIGAGLGIGMSYAVSEIANSAFGSTILKFQINYLLVFGALAFSILIGMIAGVFPARQASKLNPVEALRG